MGLAAIALNFSGQLLQRIFPPCCDDDGRAFPAQHFREGTAQSGGSAGDENGFAGNVKQVGHCDVLLSFWHAGIFAASLKTP
jgi:hypothetical protein